jgi:hypothetical protein
MESSSVIQNIGQMLTPLAKASTWHADRARRLLDAGCPKEKVREICEEEAYFVRDQLLDMEEKKLHLFPMASSIVGQQLPSDYKKLEYEAAHQARVIQRMKEREEWFQERIAQLEKFGTTVATELAEMKKKHPEPPPPPPPPSADGRPPPLKLVSRLLYPEHVAEVCRKSVLEEDNMVAGMTPTLPLLPIPSHSLKKQVSWHDIGGCPEAAAASSETGERDGEYFVYSEEGAGTPRASVGGAGH